MIHEDQLPPGYPYSAMFDQSEIVDGVRMFPDRVTVFIQIVRAEDGDAYHPDGWTPWLVNAQDDREQTLRLAVHRYIRDFGGFAHGETLALKVYHYDQTTPTYPSGKPKVCEMSLFHITRPHVVQS